MSIVGSERHGVATYSVMYGAETETIRRMYNLDLEDAREVMYANLLRHDEIAATITSQLSREPPQTIEPGMLIQVALRRSGEVVAEGMAMAVEGMERGAREKIKIPATSGLGYYQFKKQGFETDNLFLITILE